LLTPQNFNGSIQLKNPAARVWHVESLPGTRDTLVQTVLPAYSSLADSPLNTERPKSIYFEIRILRLGPKHDASRRTHLFSRAAKEDSGVAIGYFAPPYPSWRLPGWQRGSIGVHSDDGRRYVGNDEGELDFTTPFQVGETIGLGMSFALAAYSETGAKVEADVFMTRNGRRVQGWNILRESDAQGENIAGLMGDRDLFPAIGLFGPVEVEVNFGEQSWAYRGWNSRA